MSQDQLAPQQEKDLQGSVLRPNSDQELCAAVDQAFDYRGDVTVELKSGECILGYVFARTKTDSRADLEVFPTDKPGQIIIQYADIAAITFSGKDTAFGQSWESWIQKKKEEGKK
jgi:hypothetical protein